MMRILAQRSSNITIAIVMMAGAYLAAQQPAAPAKPAPAQAAPAQAAKDKGAKPAAGTPEFFLHAFHAKELGLDCNTCHVPEKEGSVVFKRPGHDQCMTCHADAFGADLNQKICAQCHSAFPPSGGDDVLPFPRFQKTRAI